MPGTQAASESRGWLLPVVMDKLVPVPVAVRVGSPDTEAPPAVAVPATVTPMVSEFSTKKPVPVTSMVLADEVPEGMSTLLKVAADWVPPSVTLDSVFPLLVLTLLPT